MDGESSTTAAHEKHEAKQRADQDVKLRLAAAVFTNTQEAIVITDAQGRVIATNPAFSTVTGYSATEIFGNTMRLIQSGQHDQAFYVEMWRKITDDGYWQGEVWNRRKNGEIYPTLLTISSVRDQNGKITNYVGSSTDLTRIRQSELKLNHLAHHDPLTELPNRRLLNSRLEQSISRAVRAGHTGAVLFLDLDRFKIVNDSLGHAAGDELLTQVAQRLKGALRATDMLARFGGDEFVLLLESTSAQAVVPAVERIISNLSEPFRLASGEEICVGVSVGISLFPDDGTSASELIQHADAALYQAKNGGKGTYRFYSTQLTQLASTCLAFEPQMRRALVRDEFVLHYQPLVSLADRGVIGVEALIRWNDPRRGLVSPAEFIPLAEETGLIVEMGDWVLRTACRQMRSWLDQGLCLDHLAVNISARQLQRPDFVDRVAALLCETRLPASKLELELTEGTVMAQDGASLEKLASLKSLGVRLAIDDFGTGYSSLAYLKRLPIDKLKIDRTFLADIPNDAAGTEIAAAIIALARTLRLEVLAEGVENASQAEFLVRRGCAMGQGHLFSRPVPKEVVPGLQGIRRAAGDGRQCVA